MRRLGILGFLFSCFLAQVGYSQPPAGVSWAVNRPLRWTDFKGMPERENELHAATTFAGIVLEVEEVAFPSGKLQFRAYGIFDIHRSWAFKDRCDERVLVHEQRHFDLAEIYARLLQAKLNALRLKVSDKEKAKKLYQHYSEQQLLTQARYDTETAHGLNTENQERWDKQIKLALNNPAFAAKIFQVR